MFDYYFLFRLEYDAYRNELETLQLGPRENASTAKVEESRRKYEDHKIKFERLRSDVNIKLKFLEENKVCLHIFEFWTML